MLFKKEHLDEIREYLKKDNLKGYLILTSDPHSSEYVSPFYLSFRNYFAPFSGSAAKLLITLDNAYLSTDGRYYIQASKELEGSGINLVKEGLESLEDDIILKKEIYPLGTSFNLINELDYERLVNKGITLVDKDYSFLIKDRPLPSKEKVFKLYSSLNTLSLKEKLDYIYQKLDEEKVEANLISSLDDIASILNIRGKDIPCNPVFYSYLYVSRKYGNHLFIDLDKIDFELNNVNIHPYDEIFNFLKEHENVSTLIDKAKSSAKIYSLLKNKVNGKNPSYLLKAIKLEKEIINTKKIQAIDGLALLKFHKYLHDNLSNNLTEFDYSKKLKEFRLSSPLCFDLSFNTIAAVGSNAALMHYSPQEVGSSVVNKESIDLLVDSGGQYYGGTTDTTRTFLIGTPTKEFIHDYTLTLKALIGVSSTIFIENSDGHTIDIKAREFMWKEGMDYKCGTGHGVGYILNVHEGPNGFRYYVSKDRDDQGKLVPGMITTIEPGVYKENKYGIRIENNLLCVNAFETNDGKFYKFETITYVPIDTKCLDLNMMSDDEIKWLNSYHKLVNEKLTPFIKEQELKDYLDKLTIEVKR